MNQDQLTEILKYSSPYSVLVVKWDGRLVEVFCPFKIKVLKDVGELRRGQTCWVSRVKITSYSTTVYIIKAKPYYYYHFELMVSDK